MKKKIIISILIAIFLELTIFNIKSYRILSNRKELTYSFNNVQEEIEINNINEDIKTIFVDIDGIEDKTLDYTINYSDETTKNRTLCTKTYYDGNEKTKYTAIFLSGKTKSITIKFDGIQDNNVEVRLNTHIPFRFNFFRVALIIFILLLIYSYKNNKFWNEKFDEKNLNQVSVFRSILMLAIFAMFLVNTLNQYEYSDLYNVKFVNAIEQGSASLLEKPSEKLLSLNNPYDSIEREGLERGKDYFWDVALYNGKFYLYFGALPALLLFVPFHMITSLYLPNSIGLMIFSCLAMIMMALNLKLLYKKWFSNLPFKILALMEIIVLFGTTIIWLNVIPNFYEVVTCAGLYFVLQGLYLIYSSDLKEKFSYKKLILGCLCMGLAVACRPTELISSILIIPFLIKNFKQCKNVKFLLSVILPYAIVGIFLMYYNYIRFENIFDFGTSYQLTVNDMRNLKGRLSILPQGIICSLFNIPTFISQFPYIAPNNNVLDVFAYLYTEKMYGGVFIFSPIAFMCLKLCSFYKNEKNKEIKIGVTCILITAILMTVVVITNGGINPRYLLDFSWLYVFTGIIIYLSCYEKLGEESKKILEKILIIITLYTLIINLLNGVGTKDDIYGIEQKVPEAFYKMEYFITFWK